MERRFEFRDSVIRRRPSLRRTIAVGHLRDAGIELGPGENQVTVNPGYVRASQYYSDPYNPFHFPPIPSAGFCAISLDEIESQANAANKIHSDLWLSEATQVMFMSYFIEMPNLDEAALENLGRWRARSEQRPRSARCPRQSITHIPRPTGKEQTPRSSAPACSNLSTSATPSLRFARRGHRRSSSAESNSSTSCTTPSWSAIVSICWPTQSNANGWHHIGDRLIVRWSGSEVGDFFGRCRAGARRNEQHDDQQFADPGVDLRTYQMCIGRSRGAIGGCLGEARRRTVVALRLCMSASAMRNRWARLDLCQLLPHREQGGSSGRVMPPLRSRTQHPRRQVLIGNSVDAASLSTKVDGESAYRRGSVQSDWLTDSLLPKDRWTREPRRTSTASKAIKGARATSATVAVTTSNTRSNTDGFVAGSSWPESAVADQHIPFRDVQQGMERAIEAGDHLSLFTHEIDLRRDGVRKNTEICLRHATSSMSLASI
ncbi:hypothetical protein GQR58_029794 [Nymphon striatum]|nr:hypothetical protein GQR58_029794 [Nymphon striatum]